MKYLPKKSLNPRAVVNREKSLIQKHYDHITCSISRGVLICNGEYQPTSESPTYHYMIKYSPPKSPSVYVKSPEIAYHEDIHMYPKDNSLCLYHKTDLVWDSSTCHLYDTIIPWTHEWFLFYELYQIQGKWLHPFVPHKKNKKA